jgi:hypothetical protein
MRNLHYFCFCFITFLFFTANVYAQDKLPIKFGKVKLEDFDVKSPLIDSSTNAVVVADVGNSEFIANTNDFSFSLLFNQKKRIKILNKNGFDAATIIIPLYVADNGKSEKIENLDAFTYNIENGKVVSTKVEKSSIYTEKKNKNWVYTKFTFPALAEGSIIEYSCRVKSDFFFNLQPWAFQGEYPVLWSEYQAAIPDFYRFIILSQGYQPFAVNTNESRVNSFSFIEHVTGNTGTGFSTQRASSYETHKIDGNIDYHTWIMKNVPALKPEAFTTTIRNSIGKIEFQLKEVAYPHQVVRPVMNNWEKAGQDLMEHEHFGMLITRPNNWLDDEVAAIVKNAVNNTEKTKKIYEYLRDNFTCTDYSGYYVTSNLKDVMKNKTGSVADINMLLIAMLRTQGIAANPVLLSTRQHGYVNEVYPLMDKYNYLVAQVSDADEVYFLDASTPRLGFNKLPPAVYNGQARVITKENALPVYFSADSLKEANTTMVFIENNSKGGVEGAVSSTLGYISSLAVRDGIAKSGVEDFKKKLKEDFTDDVELLDMKVDSLKNLDEPVAINYALKLNSFGDADVVYFNPMFGEAIKKNPFTAAERFYPVEMPYTKNDIYTLTMDMPKGYKVDELPKQARIMLNEDEGMFEYLISADESTIQMRCRLVIKKTFFPNEDYQTLRDFYAYIVKKEAEQIVFKKIK